MVPSSIFICYFTVEVPVGHLFSRSLTMNVKTNEEPGLDIRLSLTSVLVPARYFVL